MVGPAPVDGAPRENGLPVGLFALPRVRAGVAPPACKGDEVAAVVCGLLRPPNKAPPGADGAGLWPNNPPPPVLAAPKRPLLGASAEVVVVGLLKPPNVGLAEFGAAAPPKSGADPAEEVGGFPAGVVEANEKRDGFAGAGVAAGVVDAEVLALPNRFVVDVALGVFVAVVADRF